MSVATSPSGTVAATSRATPSKGSTASLDSSHRASTSCRTSRSPLGRRGSPHQRKRRHDPCYVFSSETNGGPRRDLLVNRPINLGYAGQPLRRYRHPLLLSTSPPRPTRTGARQKSDDRIKQSLDVGTGIAGFPRPVAGPSIRSNTEFPYLGLTVPLLGSAVAGRFHPHLAALGAAPLLLLVRPMGGDLHLGAAAWTSHEPVKFPRKLPNSSRIVSRPVPSKIVGESGAGNRWEQRLSTAEFQRKSGGQEVAVGTPVAQRPPRRSVHAR